MTYETVAAVTQVTAMLVFIVVFISVVAFAFWPGNKEKFDEAQRRSLDMDAERKSIGGR